MFMYRGRSNVEMVAQPRIKVDLLMLMYLTWAVTRLILMGDIKLL